MNADGSAPHTSTSNFDGANRPTWSPDGAQIAFAAGYSSVWITSSEGIGARHLVGSDAEPALEPAWSPDGRTILVSQRRAGNTDIYAVDVASGDERRLTASDGDDFEPVWSPGGTRIVFQSTRTGREDVWKMAADGSDQQQITFTDGWPSLCARQWVEIDLGRSYAVSRVALAVAQTPEGMTDHVILGRTSSTARWRGLAELRGITHDRQVLTATTTSPWRNVRYVRIETRESPSWVAWKEIAVFRAR